MYVHIVIESMTLSAKDAIIHFNTRLLEQLPLESGVFFAMVKQACLFPWDTADRIAELSTRPEKVSYFLQHVIERTHTHTHIYTQTHISYIYNIVLYIIMTFLCIH